MLLGRGSMEPEHSVAQLWPTLGSTRKAKTLPEELGEDADPSPET